MANLTPASTFDNVYQLETTDPVLGGAGGISNRQAQQLLNRTTYLKNLIDALDGSGGPFDYDASGGALPTTGSGSGGAIKRKDTYRVSVAGTVSGIALQVGDTLIAKIDAATTAANYILLQTNVDLATASVLGLVKLAQNIGGGALTDTCLSLAGLISIFAQLASPTFTGIPVAPTASPGTNNTQLSTTGYADAAVAVEAGTRASADTTLQNNITSEASTRGSADTALQNNINTEITNRTNADNTEITNRSNADANLQSQIDGSVWNNITLANGWTVSGSDTPQYRTIGGIVYLRGVIVGTFASSAFICAGGSVPNSTGRNISLTSHRLNGSSTLQVIDVAVNTSGQLTGSDRANSAFMYLDGLSYSAV